MKSGMRHEAIGNSRTAKFFAFTLSALLFALSFPAEAQQPAKIPRIGYLSPTGDLNTPVPNVEAFRQGLHDRGYVEGKNILVEYR
jgi:putative ABC transport system substrate-binding protein